jgi:hypothetical protein
LDVGQDGPVILVGENCGNNSFQTMLVRKQKSRAIVEILSIHWPSYFCLMRPPHCHRRLEIHIKLTLDVVQDGPVILGGEGRGNNSFQTKLVCKQKSREIVENSLHPLAIIFLPNAPPHCHGWPKIHIRLTMDVGQDGPVILRGEGRGNNSF